MKVKICGITNREALVAAVGGGDGRGDGADYVGFVFAESKRKISPERAKELSDGISVKKVGVFVDEAIEKVIETANYVPLDVIQLHGLETYDYVQKLSAFELIKVIKIIDGEFQQDPADFPDITLLLDAKVSGAGEKFDWEKVDLEKLKGRKFFVAGGINIDNVKEAIAYFSPYGVDVSSGVETNGLKDVGKIKAFLKRTKDCSPALY